MSETSSSKEGLPAECPVCYEKFHPLEAMRRQLRCGHIFCHDCLVKCLLSAKLDGQVQSSIICPICRYVTFLSKKKALWPPKARTNSWTLEMPLSPSSLSHLTKMEANNSLVVPSHFVMPVQSFDWCFSTGSSPMDSRGVPGKLAREVHIFVISEHGMPLVTAAWRSWIAFGGGITFGGCIAFAGGITFGGCIAFGGLIACGGCITFGGGITFGG
ncbi:hypothetical protein Q9233_014152 [Columba guinea]|nr:hypothetical protein Q9233_014152 [Columba guinea]